MLRYWLIGSASAALLALTSAPGYTAPAVGADAMQAALRQSSAVEKAAAACWWQNGMRVCSRGGAYGYNAPVAYGYYSAPRSSGYGVYYGRPRPEAFPTGSTSWWRAMDYEGRGGHGRGF